MKIDKFLFIEKKYNLCRLDIDGINIWEYIRFELWNFVFCAEALELQEAHRKEERIPLIDLMWTGIKSYVKYLFSTQKKVDVCFLTHERRVKQDNFYDCIYTEELIQRYPDSVVLEKPYKYGHLLPIRTSNLYYTDWIIILGNLSAKAHKICKSLTYKKIYERIESQWEIPFEEMKLAYGLNISFDKVVKMGVEKYFLCKTQYGMYEKILRKFSPKLIVEVCHYSRQCMLINEIAKKLNIPTVELQHGTMHSGHAAYQYYEKNEIPQLPTDILLFSDFWKTQMHMPLALEKIVTTGFPYFEKKIKEYKYEKKDNNKKTILFISQGTIGDKLSSLAVTLSKILDEEKYSIIYKLHPGEYTNWSCEYPQLKESNINVIDNSEKSIYECFANADIQVGVYSTAIYEGLAFGLQTIIYNIAHADTMKGLVEEGYAVFVNDVNELVLELKKDVEKKDGTIFWQDNALNNILNYLDVKLSKNKKKEA